MKVRTVPVTKVFLHCSASPNPAQDVEDIRRMHIVERGWEDIGYNWFIKQDGTLQQGRDEKFIPAGVEHFNNESIHICLAGLDNFKPIQFQTLKAILKIKRAQYPQATLHGHREFDRKGKTCPNFDYTGLVVMWNSWAPPYLSSQLPSSSSPGADSSAEPKSDTTPPPAR